MIHGKVLKYLQKTIVVDILNFIDLRPLLYDVHLGFHIIRRESMHKFHNLGCKFRTFFIMKRASNVDLGVILAF